MQGIGREGVVPSDELVRALRKGRWVETRIKTWYRSFEEQGEGQPGSRSHKHRGPQSVGQRQGGPCGKGGMKQGKVVGRSMLDLAGPGKALHSWVMGIPRWVLSRAVAWYNLRITGSFCLMHNNGLQDVKDGNRKMSWEAFIVHWVKNSDYLMNPCHSLACCCIIPISAPFFMWLFYCVRMSPNFPLLKRS